MVYDLKLILKTTAREKEGGFFMEKKINSDFHINAGDNEYIVNALPMLGGNNYYCEREDPKTLRNIVNVTKAMRWVAGVGDKTRLGEVGDYLQAARLEPDQSVYDEIKQRSEQVLLPVFNFDPASEGDMVRFYDLFRTACDAHDAAVAESIEKLRYVYDALTVSQLEMQQEVKAAKNPLILLEQIFRPGNKKRSYEAMRKMVSTMYLIPEFINMQKFEQVASEVNAVLSKWQVLQDKHPVQRAAIAKVYEAHGECSQWHYFDPTKDKKLHHGVDEKGSWKEMFFAYPSRETARGLLVHFTDREVKSPASIWMKTMRKMELNDDHYAMRFVIDEKSSPTQEQIGQLCQEIADAFRKEGYSVGISTEKGYTNTMTAEFRVVLNGKQIFMPSKNNSHNPTTSPERRVFQADWRYWREGEPVRQFELQIFDTLGDINRQTNESWSDPVYKAKQFTDELPSNEESNLAQILFPPFYAQGLLAESMNAGMKKRASVQSLSLPANNLLPS